MKTGLLLCLMCVSGVGLGQNLIEELVPNGSFEQYTACPVTNRQITYATDWRAVEGTPDYYNACSTNSKVGVPFNEQGYQPAHTGQAYGHLIVYSPWSDSLAGPDPLGLRPRFREYMQIPLLHPLIAERSYEVSFYVSLTDKSAYAVDQIGVFFSENNDKIWIESPGFTVPVPQVVSPVGQIVSDISEWRRISGMYKANGGERYLTVGRFVANEYLTIQTMDSSTRKDPARVASYYIDDVSVLGETVFIPNVITPNGDGSNDYWRIQNLGTDTWHLQICNQWGTRVYTAYPYQNEWNAQNLPNGVYYYLLTNGRRRYRGWLQVLR